MRDAATDFAKNLFQNSVVSIGAAAVALALAAGPADAKAQKKPPEQGVPGSDNGEPVTLVISTGQQKIDVYRGMTLLTSSQVSTGTAAHPTFLGVFSIIEKQRWHHSNIYSGAPMPWMNRITWSGTALHAGVVPDYPASHGCIRLLYSFAPKLYQITKVGDGVVITRDRPAPTPIEHPALFQPLPPPPPSITEKEKAQPHERATELLRPLGAPNSAIILAKAELAEDDINAAPAPKPVAEQHAMSDAPDAGDAGHPVAVKDDEPYRAHAVADATGGMTGTAHATRADASAPAKPEAKTTAPEVTSPPSPSAPLPASTAAASAAQPKPAALAQAGPAPKIEAGVEAAAIQAAKAGSNAPLRILVTRRTQRDQIVGVQKILASMGYLPMMNFDGTIGKPTVGAIKAFQKANGVLETGAFTDDLVKKVYEVAGQREPPAGHLWVRQDLSRMFDTPITLKDPQAPLGTHVYTALKFAPSDTKAQWMTITLVDTGQDPLDRIEIPDDVRQKISERLTSGSSLIVADNTINTAGLPKGGDFVVLSNYSVAKGNSNNNLVAKGGSAVSDHTTVAKPKKKRQARRYYRSNTPRYYSPFWIR
jgi:peptidoglycan hydrolase-like protein with peptidoglycan-binding domain